MSATGLLCPIYRMEFKIPLTPVTTKKKKFGIASEKWLAIASKSVSAFCLCLHQFQFSQLVSSLYG